MVLLIFGFFIAGIILFKKISSKFNNPHQLILIFGKKGSSKTTLMCKMMIEDLKHGWHVYTDIQTINIPGVRVFSARDLEFMAPVPHSAVYLDEVGITYDNRQFSNFPAGVRDYYVLQRHAMNKVVMASQNFNTDKKLRDLTDSFIYQSKIAGVIGLSRPVVLKVQPNDMSSPNCDSPMKTSYKWGSFRDWKITWIPKYARYFNSFDFEARPDVKWREIPGDLKQLRKKPWQRFKRKR